MSETPQSERNFKSRELPSETAENLAKSLETDSLETLSDEQLLNLHRNSAKVADLAEKKSLSVMARRVGDFLQNELQVEVLGIKETEQSWPRSEHYKCTLKLSYDVPAEHPSDPKGTQVHKKLEEIMGKLRQKYPDLKVDFNGVGIRDLIISFAE